VRLGIADHFGWAVAVTADDDHQVVDRRRIELVEDGVTPAPFHYESHALDLAATTALVAEVRASIVRATDAALDALPDGIVSMSLRAIPTDFPEDIAVLMRSPWEARADAVLYRQVLIEAAEARGWAVHVYDAKHVERQAAELLGPTADEILTGPRKALGPPWARDHRTALAATVLAA
jgi:hypothetical protein